LVFLDGSSSGFYGYDSIGDGGRVLGVKK